jgi:type III restriction enzyme
VKGALFVKQVVIENPIINTPFKEPKRHFKFTEEGMTNEIVEERRPSAYFIPIARPRSKRKQAQLSLDTEWAENRLKENDEINRIRTRVDAWRKGGYSGVTKTIEYSHV